MPEPLISTVRRIIKNHGEPFHSPHDDTVVFALGFLPTGEAVSVEKERDGNYLVLSSTKSDGDRELPLSVDGKTPCSDWVFVQCIVAQVQSLERMLDLDKAARRLAI